MTRPCCVRPPQPPFANPGGKQHSLCPVPPAVPAVPPLTAALPPRQQSLSAPKLPPRRMKGDDSAVDGGMLHSPPPTPTPQEGGREKAPFSPLGGCHQRPGWHRVWLGLRCANESADESVWHRAKLLCCSKTGGGDPIRTRRLWAVWTRPHCSAMGVFGAADTRKFGVLGSQNAPKMLPWREGT